MGDGEKGDGLEDVIRRRCETKLLTGFGADFVQRLRGCSFDLELTGIPEHGNVRHDAKDGMMGAVDCRRW